MWLDYDERNKASDANEQSSKNQRTLPAEVYGFEEPVDLPA